MSPISEKTHLLSSSTSHGSKGNQRYVLVIHGGAGIMDRAKLTPEIQQLYHAALRKSLRAGYEVLSNGGEAMDAVVAAVSVMEDDPLFNAGKGAVFNTAGKNELESSIMLSKPPASHSEIPATRRGLGITLMTRIKNPSRLARLLYLSPEEVPHTYVSGTIAEDIGASLGETLVDPSYFFTTKRWLEHRRGLGLPDEPYPPGTTPDDGPEPSHLDALPKGTVGAVALDMSGCIVSLTSTGGKTNKLPGRIGDTPTMSAGFWAEEWKTVGWFRRKLRKWHKKSVYQGVGVSGTGDGDYFIRHATASTIASRMRLLNQSVHKAAQLEIDALLKDGGIGGVICIDKDGNVAMPMNSTGMNRGVIREDGVAKTAIFNDDVLAEM